MGFPSVRTIMTIEGITQETAKQIRQALESSSDPEKALSKVDNLMGTCGVEYVKHVNDNMFVLKGISYCNAGDSYDRTLLYLHDKQIFRVGNWADIVESHPYSYI